MISVVDASNSKTMATYQAHDSKATEEAMKYVLSHNGTIRSNRIDSNGDFLIVADFK